MIEIIGHALNQWDVGRSAKVTNIEADHFHFANKGDLKAVVMKIVDSQAKIPDYLLQTGKQLCVYAVKDGVTIESRTFSVRNRERPESYVYEEDQRNYIYELITSAEVAVEDANLAAKNANEAAESANTSVVNAKTATDNANNAAVSANESAKNANEAAVKAYNAAKNLTVVGWAEGANIYLDDAIDQYLVGLRIFGKSTQAGTPKPDAPVDLVSVGDYGNIGVTVVGKNLVDIAKATPTGSERISISGDTIIISAGSSIYGVKLNGVVLEVGRTYTMSVGNVSQHDVNFGFRIIYHDDTISNTYGDRSLLTLTVTKPIKSVYFYAGYGFTSTSQISVTQLQIEEGSTRTAYEPYKAQSLTISTPNGLPGIPVTSGGNYTDANGQQWICDEIDFDKGVYLQRCMKLTANQLVPFHYYELANCARVGCNLTLKSVNYANGLSTHLPLISNYTMDTPHFYSADGALWIFASISELTERSKEGAIAWANRLGIEFVYALETPIETSLSEEELAAYAALHTYRDNTTVYNDASAHMEIKYVMDAKKYIDKMVSSTILQATIE